MRVRVLTVLLLVAAAPAMYADYRDSYAQGLRARDEKRWRDVTVHMAAAIAEQPAEGETVRPFVLFETYLPYYYLGVAHAELGNCESAVAAWQESLRQGAIARPGNESLHRRLQQGLDACDPAKALENVPPKLVQAVRAYFNGEYAQVVELLKDESFSRSAMTAQQHLFLAAAQYARYLLGGSVDGALLRDAEDHVRRVRRAESTLTPRRDVFSPRFVAFFSAVR